MGGGKGLATRASLFRQLPNIQGQRERERFSKHSGSARKKVHLFRYRTFGLFF